MKYALAGKSETFNLYCHINKQQPDKDVIYAKTEKIFNQITSKDTIVLLSGWWGKSWAKEAFRNAITTFPGIEVDYLDGKFGEEQREGISAQKSTLTRFDLIDLE